MKSLTLREELKELHGEIKKDGKPGFYFWNIPADRKRELENAGFDFIKEAEDEDLQEILKKQLFGVEHAINTYGMYILIRFYN